jgi:hypothetical protein
MAKDFTSDLVGTPFETALQAMQNYAANTSGDKKTLVEAVEKMASDARNQLHNLEKTLDLFRIINRNVRSIKSDKSEVTNV